MKISYATPAGSPSYTVLGDEADRSMLLELFSPAFQPLNQIEPLAGGSNTFKAVRDNVQVTLTLSASIPYSTRANALAGVATLRAAFTVKKHLKVEQDATVHYYPNAVLSGYQPVLKGVTVQHNFTFSTDDLTTTAPTT
jgi:hypothetical protein